MIRFFGFLAAHPCNFFVVLPIYIEPIQPYANFPAAAISVHVYSLEKPFGLNYHSEVDGGYKFQTSTNMDKPYASFISLSN